MRVIDFIRLAASLTFVILSPFASGQAIKDPATPQFAVGASVVLVPATVMSREGAIVTGLAPEAFEITQDNRPQRITSFAEEDVPVSLGIVLDVSGSMQPVLSQAKYVLKKFFAAANPDDEAFLFTVAGRPNRESGFTQNIDTLLDQALFRDAGGSTALVDTIYAALAQMRKASHARKAILVISDGMDNHSRYTARELMSAAVEADLQIYSISVFDPPRNKKPIELREERAGIAFLEELTHKTGGVSLVVRDGRDAMRAADRISRIMRDQYLLGYIPPSYVPGASFDAVKWHSIKVAVRVPDAQAYARSGYYSK